MAVHEPEIQVELSPARPESGVQHAPPVSEHQQAAKGSTTSSRPRRSRRLLRYFLIQLLPVTAGILIALLIDGLIELRRQVVLVNEAHAALAAEIASNNTDLLETMPSLEQTQEILLQTVTYRAPPEIRIFACELGGSARRTAVYTPVNEESWPREA